MKDRDEMVAGAKGVLFLKVDNRNTCLSADRNIPGQRKWMFVWERVLIEK